MTPSRITSAGGPRWSGWRGVPWKTCRHPRRPRPLRPCRVREGDPEMWCPSTRDVAFCACLFMGTGPIASPLQAAAEPGRANETLPVPAGPTVATPLTLADLEQMAVRGNPTLAQAAAQVEAAHGRAVQAGLCPNPTVGYQAELIGVMGTAGEMQGVFIDQTIVTAGK